MSGDEGRQLLAAWIQRAEAMDWEAAAALGAAPLVEHVQGASGASYRIHVSSFWDMEPWMSDLHLEVRVYPDRGWRRWRGYRGASGKPGEELPE